MSTGGNHDFITFTPPLPNNADPQSTNGEGFYLDSPFATSGGVGDSLPVYDFSTNFNDHNLEEAHTPFEILIDEDSNDNPFASAIEPTTTVQQPLEQTTTNSLISFNDAEPPTFVENKSDEPNLYYDDDNPFINDINSNITVNVHNDTQNTVTTTHAFPDVYTQSNDAASSTDDDNPFKNDINTARELGVIPPSPLKQSEQDPFSQDPFSQSGQDMQDPFSQEDPFSQQYDDQVPHQFVYGNDPFTSSEDPFSETNAPQQMYKHDFPSFDDTITFETDESSRSPPEAETSSIDITIQLHPTEDVPPVPKRPPKQLALTSEQGNRQHSSPSPQQGSSSDGQGIWINSRLKKTTVIQKAMNMWNKPHEPTLFGSRSSSAMDSSPCNSESSSTRTSTDERPASLQPTYDEVSSTPFVHFVENPSLTSLTQQQQQVGDPQLLPQNGNNNGTPVKFLQICVPEFHVLKMVEFDPLENTNNLLTRVLGDIASKESTDNFKAIYPVFLGGQTMRAFEMDRWTSLGAYGLGMQVREDVQLLFILRNSVGSNYDFQKYEIYTKKMIQTPNDVAVGAWLDVLDDWGLGGSSIRLITKRKKLKKLTTAGIPYAVRGWAWCQLADTFTIKDKNHNVYEELLDKIPEMPQEYERKIRVDLPRSLPTHPFFKEEGLGQDSLNRVLKCYCNYDSEIRYCQGINFLSAMLLCYMNERVNYYTYPSSYLFLFIIIILILSF